MLSFLDSYGLELLIEAFMLDNLDKLFILGDL